MRRPMRTCICRGTPRVSRPVATTLST
jgi:hypothetical protein